METRNHVTKKGLRISLVTCTGGVSPLPYLIYDTISLVTETEKHLLPVSSEDIRDSFLKGNAIIGMYGGSVICYCRIIPLLPKGSRQQFYELGTTWVDRWMRGHGINHLMYHTFLPMHKNKNILATTTNPVSRKVGEDLGLVTVTRKQLPTEAWQSSCTCPAEKTGCSLQNLHCKLAYGEPQCSKNPCYFRITKETAERLNIS